MNSAGEVPFDGSDELEIYRKILTKHADFHKPEFSLEDNDVCNHKKRNFQITKCLLHKDEKRRDASELFKNFAAISMF